MFSLPYFKYLFKSKKYFLLIIALLTILSAFTSSGGDKTLTYIVEILISIFVSYFLVINTFYYVHDKKAVDTFFSIPISRKAMLVTGLIFCTIVTFIPFAVGTYVFGLQESKFYEVTLFLLFALLGICALICFNTSTYLLANNSFDGIVMIGAYTVLPLMMYAVSNIFMNSYVCGLQSYDFDYFVYLSPLGMLAKMVVSSERFYIPGWQTIAGFIVFLLASLFVLNKEYINRKVERASTPSDGIFTYPIIINVYVFMVLFLAASGYNYYYRNIWEFFGDFFIVYLLIFAIYVAAHFMHKRKFYMNFKLPLVFILITALTFGVGLLARNTNGFGLSQSYPKYDKTAEYQLNGYFYYEQNELAEYIKETNSEDTIGYLYYSIGTDDWYKDRELKDSTVQIFEEIRQEAIKQFYESNDKYSYMDFDSNINLSVNSKQNGKTKYYYYSVSGYYFRLDDFKTLASDPYIDVTFSTNYGDYKMKTDGTLVQVNSYIVE